MVSLLPIIHPPNLEMQIGILVSMVAGYFYDFIWPQAFHRHFQSLCCLWRPVQCRGRQCSVEVVRASKLPVRHHHAASRSWLPVGGPCNVELVHASELPRTTTLRPAGACCWLASRAVRRRA